MKNPADFDNLPAESFRRLDPNDFKKSLSRIKVCSLPRVHLASSNLLIIFALAFGVGERVQALRGLEQGLRFLWPLMARPE